LVAREIRGFFSYYMPAPEEVLG
jgi:hypothetical protein